MDIQIDSLSLKELVELHDRIARRMWDLGRTELAAKLAQFQIGQQVCFQHEGNKIPGTIIRVNRKSLSIRAQQACFYVPPWAVTKIMDITSP